MPISASPSLCFQVKGCIFASLLFVLPIEVCCQPPSEVDQGYVVAVQKSEYEVGFDIHYLCKKNFLLDGPQKVTCLPNGTWSASPPHCRGGRKIFQTIKIYIYIASLPLPLVCLLHFWPHLVAARCLIPAERSRVVVGGVKRWPFDVTDAMVPHGEVVTFYCKHPDKQCSFTAAQSCFDGNLQPPACYLGKELLCRPHCLPLCLFPFIWKSACQTAINRTQDG